MTRQRVEVTRFSLPHDWEEREIEAIFHELDMDARVQGESFAGPAEFFAGVTVATMLVPFFQAIVSKAGDDAYLSLKKLTARLVAFGRGPYKDLPEGDVSFTERFTKLRFDPRLPDSAFRQLFTLDLKQFENVSVTISYSDRWGRWLAYPSPMTTRLARRVPVISSRASKAYTKAPSVRGIVPGENARLFKDRSKGSAVTSQRFEIIMKSVGWRHDSVDIAAEMVVSEDLVRSVFGDFNHVGFDSLYAKYDDGRSPTLTPEQANEIVSIAASSPAAYDAEFPVWTYPSLVDFLVVEGIVEDIGYPALKRFLNERGVRLSGSKREKS
jgi:transposase